MTHLAAVVAHPGAFLLARAARPVKLACLTHVTRHELAGHT